MDLSKVDYVARADEGEWMTVTDPLGAELVDEVTKKPARLKLVGLDSKRYRDKNREIQDRRIEKMRRNKPTTSKLHETETRDLIAHCVLDWEEFYSDGQPLECNPENVRMLFEKVPYIQLQADNFIGDRANFMKGSSSP